MYFPNHSLLPNTASDGKAGKVTASSEQQSESFLKKCPSVITSPPHPLTCTIQIISLSIHPRKDSVEMQNALPLLHSELNKPPSSDITTTDCLDFKLGRLFCRTCILIWPQYFSQKHMPSYIDLAGWWWRGVPHPQHYGRCPPLSPRDWGRRDPRCPADRQRCPGHLCRSCEHPQLYPPSSHIQDRKCSIAAPILLSVSSLARSGGYITSASTKIQLNVNHFLDEVHLNFRFGHLANNLAAHRTQKVDCWKKE